MIEQLTPEQDAKLDSYYEKWVEIGLRANLNAWHYRVARVLEYDYALEESRQVID